VRRTIAFLVDSLVDGYQQSLWAGVRAAAEAFDLNLLCFVAGYTDHRQPGRRIFELVDGARLTGVLALSGTLGGTDADLRALYARFGVPVVGIGRAVGGVPTFLLDNESSVAALVDHMVVAHGRRRFAFVRGPPGNVEGDARYAGFHAALARHGLEEDPRRVVAGSFATEGGIEAARGLLDRGVEFDALLAANDSAAIGAARELLRRGVSVPEQVSVAGFDDANEAAGATPSLTTIRQPLFELAREAIAVLLRCAEGQPLAPLHVLPGQIVARRSCGCEPLRGDVGAARGAPPAQGSRATPPGPPALCATLNARFPGIGERLGEPGWCAPVAEALLAALDRGEPSSFVDALGHLLRTGNAAHVDVLSWFDVVDALLETVEQAWPGRAEDLRRLRDAGHRTLARSQERLFTASRVALERHVNALRRLWQMNPADPEEVWLTLRAKLPLMGIPSCYLCSFTDPDRRLASLDFHSATSDTVALEAGAEPFPEARLVPGTFSAERRYGFLVMPIKARGAECGYVVCEIGTMEPAGYESLYNQLSAATELRKLLAEVRSYATELEARIEVRSEQLREAQRQVVDSAHRAGMAEVAVGLMHNVGNLLNSVGVSAERIAGLCDERRLDGILKTAALLEAPPAELLDSLVHGGRAGLVAQYLRRAAEELQRERQAIRTEGLESLDKVAMIRETVQTLQEYARGESELALQEPLDLREVVETAIKILDSALSRWGVRVVRDLIPVPPVLAQRSKLVHVVVNLAKNGIEAMQGTPSGERLLTLRLRTAGDAVELRVVDQGEGIPEAQLMRVFGYGFTTKKGGHGFGLHTCANHVAQMGGSIHAESAGAGRGACFVVRFPLAAGRA
jgi:DNA-binding LacI/PurR family transcriptional regulator/signal transduction histidine kinase